MKEIEIKNHFENVYENLSDEIFRFIVLRVDSREDALDILQEVFFKFWQTLEKGETVLKERGFLFKVARNKVIDWYKKKKPASLESFFDEDGEEVEVVIPDEGSYREMNLSSEAVWALEMLKKIPPLHAEMIRMRFIENMTLTEIAELLSISHNAVSLLINRALAVFRKELGIDLDNK